MRSFRWVGACAIVALAVSSVSTSAFAQSGGGEVGVQEDSSAPPPAQAAEASAAPPTCLCIGQGNPSRIEHIKQMLRTPLSGTGLQFADVPLEQVVASLRDQYDIEVQIDKAALDDIALTPEDEVTVDLQNISLQSALKLMLESLQLTYVIRDEVLMITTPEEANWYRVTCVYDVRDLIVGQSENQGIQAITAAIVSCVAPETWAKSKEGCGHICALRPGILVVLQTPQVHEQIGQLLASIRKVRGEEKTTTASARLQSRAAQIGGGGGGYGFGTGGFSGGFGFGGGTDLAELPSNVAEEGADEGEVEENPSGF